MDEELKEKLSSTLDAFGVVSKGSIEVLDDGYLMTDVGTGKQVGFTNGDDLITAFRTMVEQYTAAALEAVEPGETIEITFAIDKIVSTPDTPEDAKS